jgi:hypothetical protein
MTRSFRSIPRQVALAIFLAGLSLAAGVASAAETARDVVRPVLTRPQFALYASAVTMTRDQQMIADLVFGDYVSDLESLLDLADERAEAAGRSRVDRALAGKLRVPPAELREMRIGVLETYAAAVPEASALFEKLLSDLRELLLQEQRGAAANAERMLRRRVLLQPRQEGRLDQSYAGDGVDLLELVDEASRRGGELEAMRAGRLDGLLSDYATLLDALLVDSGAEWFERRLRLRMARVSRDDDAIRREEARGLEPWRRIDELNRRTAEQIGRIAAEDLGAAAQQRWLDRFDRACYPWLLGRDVVDRQADWIRRNVEDPETVRHAESIWSTYDAARRALARRTIAIMRRGRVELRAVLYPMMEPVNPGDSARRDLYQDLLKNSGEQTTLETDARGRLEALLEGSQRQRLRRETAGGR